MINYIYRNHDMNICVLNKSYVDWTRQPQIVVVGISMLYLCYRKVKNTRTKLVCADIIVSCVLPGFLFVIVVVDDGMEARSRSSLCVQKTQRKRQRYFIVVLVLVVVVVVVVVVANTIIYNSFNS